MTGPGPFLLRTFIHPQCLAAALRSPPTPALLLYRALRRLWAHKLKLNQAQQAKGEAMGAQCYTQKSLRYAWHRLMAYKSVGQQDFTKKFKSQFKWSQENYEICSYTGNIPV